MTLDCLALPLPRITYSCLALRPPASHYVLLPRITSPCLALRPLPRITSSCLSLRTPASHYVPRATHYVLSHTGSHLPPIFSFTIPSTKLSSYHYFSNSFILSYLHLLRDITFISPSWSTLYKPTFLKTSLPLFQSSSFLFKLLPPTWTFSIICNHHLRLFFPEKNYCFYNSATASEIRFIYCMLTFGISLLLPLCV